MRSSTSAVRCLPGTVGRREACSTTCRRRRRAPGSVAAKRSSSRAAEEQRELEHLAHALRMLRRRAACAGNRRQGASRSSPAPSLRRRPSCGPRGAASRTGSPDISANSASATRSSISVKPRAVRSRTHRGASFGRASRDALASDSVRSRPSPPAIAHVDGDAVQPHRERFGGALEIGIDVRRPRRRHAVSHCTRPSSSVPRSVALAQRLRGGGGVEPRLRDQHRAAPLLAPPMRC